MRPSKGPGLEEVTKGAKEKESDREVEVCGGGAKTIIHCHVRGMHVSPY